MPFNEESVEEYRFIVDVVVFPFVVLKDIGVPVLRFLPKFAVPKSIVDLFY